LVVIAGLDPAIHGSRAAEMVAEDQVDARIKSGHDDRKDQNIGKCE
jgi:hypothetical protein